MGGLGGYSSRVPTDAHRGVIARYRPRLRLAAGVEAITLGEGSTPLLSAPRLAEALGLTGVDLWLKYEGMNPTGSFKDRGMTVAISQAKHEGARAAICASTGNTAASAAAYCARAGMRCVVLIPEGKVALGKLAGALAYGAQVVQVLGSFDDALRMVRELADHEPIALVNSVNPYRLEGQKTASFEVIDALGFVPDWLALPVGNAGNISAYALGFREAGRGLPRFLGAQAEGAAPIVRGHVVERPETFATAIRIGNPARWQEAETALQESHGHILAVSDLEIERAYHLVSETEGVFCEPSSAAGLAGLAKHRESVRGTVVAVLTGHGLKDPDSAMCRPPLAPAIEPTLEALRMAAGSPA